VLYRTNPQSRVLEEALRVQNIPYRVVGGASFFERKEVVDCLALLRAVVAPNDEIALRRIINYPARGIGRTSVLKLAALARASGRPFAALLATVTATDIGAAPAAAVHAFHDMLQEARAQLRAAESAAAIPPPATGWPPIAAWADAFLRRIGIEDAIRAEFRNDRTADVRVDNVRDVVGTIARYERKVWSEAGGEEWEPPELSNALARLTLAEFDDDEETEAERTGVTLMTMHAAKGLEFSDVFIVGLEEGLIPHARSLVDDGEGTGYSDPLAEERRLLYVGITRARQRLTLSYCLNRRRGGNAVTCLPSRYLEEIPEDLIEVRDTGTTLTPEESVNLRQNFFASMKDLLHDA
jgi:superfamily I DNA/RNA helicase